MTKENFQPGQNVKVSSCNKSIPFCEVSAKIVEMRESGDPRIPLKTPSCHCSRFPEAIETIPDRLF
jgi:hypothetical protein